MSSMKDRLDKSTEMKLKRQIAELKKVEFFIGICLGLKLENWKCEMEPT